MNLNLFYAITLTFLIAAVSAVPQDGVVTDKNGNVTKGGKLADSKPQPTPLEQGMKPIFDITKYFLNNILQPDARGPPDVLVQSVVRIAEEDFDYNILLRQMEDNWQGVSMYYLGFAICIIIGLLFIIVMPIVGFCFCCCRVCGNCGGDAGQMDPKFAKCKQGTYTVILLLLTTVMLAGVVCAFVTNDLFHTQISDRDRGYVSNLNRSVTGLERYMDNTAQELKTDVVKQVNTGIDNVSGMVNRTGTVVVDELKVVTGAGELINNITELAEDIPRLKSEFQGLKNEINGAKTDSTQLENSLSNAKNKIQTGLQGCDLQNCRDAKSNANKLTVGVDWNQIPNLDSMIATTDKYVELEGLIRDAKTDFDKIGTNMTKRVEREIKNAVDELESTKTEIDGKMGEFETRLQNISSMIGQANKFLENVPKESEYYTISVFVGVGLSCIFLLIVMLLYMGMTFGVCGERPYDDARFCNKGVGANFLMASVGFMFMFSAVLMLLTLILFLVGAPFQTEICRHLVTPLNSKFIDRIDVYFNLGQFIYGSNSKEKLTIKEVLTKCENNTAVYSALKLNRTYDIGSSIDDIITQIEPEIKKVMDDIKGTGSQTMEVIPDNLKTKLAELKSEGNLNTDFSNAINELKKPITMDLTTYITQLEMLGINSNDVNDAIRILRGLSQNQVPALTNRVSGIRSGLESVKRVNKIPQKVSDIEAGIAAVQNKLNPPTQTASVGEAADKALQKFMELTRALAQDLTVMVEDDIGRCRPIYNSYHIIVTATCDDVLNPFNSFWCAFGLCLILFIPTIIFAVKLAGLYRKTDKYVGKPFETLGTSNVYPGDHIPLDDVRKPPPYRDTRAHPSSGYDNNHSSAPPLEYGQGMLDFEMPYAVPARKGLYPSTRDNRPLLDQQM